uniref:Uncharacterized protein n=1 Tax=Meloidogyne incognita TaxID=6306 RepID=A0A914NWK1_MELIC
MVAANPIEQFSNVAIRQRIKCLKPENGLPMSVQWSPIPYFYPVQILQFGFDYFMRNRTEQRKLIERRLSNKDDFLVLKSGEKGFYKLNMELEKVFRRDGGHLEIIFLGLNNFFIFLRTNFCGQLLRTNFFCGQIFADNFSGQIFLRTILADNFCVFFLFSSWLCFRL